MFLICKMLQSCISALLLHLQPCHMLQTLTSLPVMQQTWWAVISTLLVRCQGIFLMKGKIAAPLTQIFHIFTIISLSLVRCPCFTKQPTIYRRHQYHPYLSGVCGCLTKQVNIYGDSNIILTCQESTDVSQNK